MCNRWLLFRFDSLGAITVLIVTVGSLFVGAQAGLAGIIVTQVRFLDSVVARVIGFIYSFNNPVQAQQYVRSLYWGLRSWTELEQSCELAYLPAWSFIFP